MNTLFIAWLRKSALFLTVLVLALPVFAQTNIATGSRSGNLEFKGCYARWGETGLTVGNTRFERKWILQDGHLKAASFCTKNPNFEWFVPSKTPCSPTERLTVTTHTGRLSPVEAESLRLEITVSNKLTHHYEMRVFPEADGVLVCGEVPAQDASSKIEQSKASGIETSPSGQTTSDHSESLENFTFVPEHLRLTEVTLIDQTDIHNELASEREWLLAANEETLQFSGNLIFLEDTLTGAGLVLLKLAPLPHARREKASFDFTVNARAKTVQVASTDAPIITLAYRGGRWGRIAALHNFQRQLRVPDFARDGVFLSNTWGDRSRDARINESFILKEIVAGARLGVDVVQIDDGWQKGRSSNSAKRGGVWSGFWAADSQFWNPDLQRFPNGLEPVVQAARSKGMKLGLWFAPDSSNDAGNWERDANRILELYNTLGIEYFKIDSLNTGSALAASNAQKLFNRVLERSQGHVVFDLDVTAGLRSGYFGRPEIGPVFIENRYTDFHTYWPHQSLRNLWMLSQYVDPLRLRVEFLNNARNQDKYDKDPLAPACYSPDCLFAMVMFSNPLGWFEVSNLPQDYQTSAAQLIRLWKKERERLYAGSLLPIGSAPDGVNWSGFASVGPQRHDGYFVIFRELNESSEWSADLSMFSGEITRVTVLSGEGTAEINKGKLNVKVPKPLQYLWVRIDGGK